jgi:hypothetical protein
MQMPGDRNIVAELQINGNVSSYTSLQSSRGLLNVKKVYAESGSLTVQ